MDKIKWLGALLLLLVIGLATTTVVAIVTAQTQTSVRVFVYEEVGEGDDRVGRWAPYAPQAGDVLFHVSIPAVSTTIIQETQKRAGVPYPYYFFSHSAIIVPDPDDPTGKKIAVFDANVPTNTAIKDWQKYFDGISKRVTLIAVRRLKEPLSPEEIEKMKKFAAAQKNTPSLELCRIFDFQSRVINREKEADAKNRPKGWTCSALAAACFQATGRKLDMEPYFTTPGDLAAIKKDSPWEPLQWIIYVQPPLRHDPGQWPWR